MFARIKLRPFIAEVQYELVPTDALYATDAAFFVGNVQEMFQTPRRALPPSG